MKDQDQIVALAELDGWTGVNHCTCAENKMRGRPSGVDFGFSHLPDYLTSYDDILPLIQKQQNIVVEQVICHCLDLVGHEPETKVCVMDLIGLFRVRPAQLCEALLKATGKWKE